MLSLQPGDADADAGAEHTYRVSPARNTRAARATPSGLVMGVGRDRPRVGSGVGRARSSRAAAAAKDAALRANDIPLQDCM